MSLSALLQKAVTLYKVSDGGDDSVEIEEVGTRPLTQDMLHSEVRLARGVAPPENGSSSALTSLHNVCTTSLSSQIVSF